MSDNTFKINTIPSLTWNHLNMNEAEIEAVKVCPGLSELNEQIPESIELSEAEPSYASDIRGGTGEVFDSMLKSNLDKCRVLTCKEGAAAEEPVVISVNCKDGSAEGKKYVLEAEANSKVTIVTDFSSDDGAKGRSCFQTLIRIGKGAEVTLVQTDRLSSDFELINDVGAVLEEDAILNIVHIFLGGSNIYQGCNIVLKGDRAVVNKDIGYFLKEEQDLDMNYVVIHEGKKTECDIKASGVLEGESSKLFRGTIDFKNGCAGSKGAEIEEVILRDDTAHNKTIPVILCAEEDVEGSHGATIGRIDEDLIFYMQTRGFEEEEIYKLISKSRLLSFCSKIPDEDIRAKTMTF